MNNTLFVLNSAVNLGVGLLPFSDKILNKQSAVDIRDLQNRQKVAKSMEKAILDGKLDESFQKPVMKMKENLNVQIIDSNLNEESYIYNQAGSAAKFFNILIPGSGAVLTNIARVGQAAVLFNHREEMSNAQATTRIANIVKPVITGVAIASALPYALNPAIVPLTPLHGAMAATSLFGMLMLTDAITYAKDLIPNLQG